ncbi:hypothetical protein [Aminivibrio sp.]|jgi:hypothetical protein|uniref:hypothetical protein n=1 Tax=Aminivibrio sp. TaxID=1872489 RepID=UPI00169053BB|nr:hypothetical protein [Synergistaceae bacterium]MDD3390113.1 hypothetical protein [Synergistaceae bacterium]MDD4021852.1 hypothetical protein [Synergistaceae bacterium]MDD4611736.1 hypothetical protein [Synergistaceae bacterium]NLO58108.1 hypothetical protein [Synergistaceae bacterium]
MKNMLKLLVLFFTVFLVFPAVPAPGQTSGENPEEPEIITVSEDVRILRYYSARGTRSEARHHYLEIEGERIPDVFSKVVYKGLSFTFGSRKYHWGDDGYLRGSDAEVTGSPSPISAEQLERGWYEGGGILQGTPENWIYGEWKGGALLAAPEKLGWAVETLDLPVIPRDASGIGLILAPENTKPVQEKNDEGLSEDALKSLEEALKKRK